VVNSKCLTVNKPVRPVGLTWTSACGLLLQLGRSNDQSDTVLAYERRRAASALWNTSSWS